MTLMTLSVIVSTHFSFGSMFARASQESRDLSARSVGWVRLWIERQRKNRERRASIAKAARKADHLIVTQKDAVKLQGRWPASVPEPLVAILEVQWELGEAEIRAALDGVLSLRRGGGER